MPGILIAHSHHRPKTQGELQDMGMTWARAGCVVLVIDQLGHGERADHPFQSEQDYTKNNSGYRWWRQDYYYLFDVNAQLHLIGDSLMCWMAWDLMRGVDLLLARPGIDPKKILLLGAVAGGGDPAAGRWGGSAPCECRLFDRRSGAALFGSRAKGAVRILAGVT